MRSVQRGLVRKLLSFICFTNSRNLKCHYFLSLGEKYEADNNSKLSPRLLLRRRMSELLFKQSCDHRLVELTSLGLSQTCETMDDLLTELLKQPVKDSWCHSPKSSSPLIWLFLVTNMRNFLTALIMRPCKWSQTWEQSGPGFEVDCVQYVGHILSMISLSLIMCLSFYVYRGV